MKKLRLTDNQIVEALMRAKTCIKNAGSMLEAGDQQRCFLPLASPIWRHGRVDDGEDEGVRGGEPAASEYDLR